MPGADVQTRRHALFLLGVPDVFCLEFQETIISHISDACMLHMCILSHVTPYLRYSIESPVFA